MPCVNAVVQCPVHRGFRTQQAASMFDVSLDRISQKRFSVQLPDDEESWQIGLIVGPSGSGKSTVARHAWPEAVWHECNWPDDRSVIEAMAPVPVSDATAMLTSVGFGSPPAWLRPYGVLSNGEQFRCDLARALCSDQPMVVFDEFTSVVDRTVAKIGSAAVSRAIRRGRIDKRFVAVSCHYDIADWLEPDWVLDMATGQLARGRLRRPEIGLAVHSCSTAAWELFKSHHYLSGRLHPGSRKYLLSWEQRPVGFCATLGQFGQPGIRRVHRLVVLPDYQGIGIGGRLLDAVAQLERVGCRGVRIVTGHPGLMRGLAQRRNWRLLGISRRTDSCGGKRRSQLRLTGRFQYCGGFEGAGSAGSTSVCDGPGGDC